MGMVMARTINYWHVLLSVGKTSIVTIQLPENEQKRGENYQDRPPLCRMQLKRANKFWTLVPQTKTRKMSVSACVLRHLICEL
jgi:hypothetical protein